MTVLDHVRPTVVVRRRIVDVAPLRAPAPAVSAVSDEADEADESPPSSVFVHPGYLQPAEELESSDTEEDEGLEAAPAPVPAVDGAPPAEPAAPKPPPRREVSVPRDATVGEVAKSVGVPQASLVADLVGRGLFATTSRTPLSIEAKRAIEDTCDITLLLTAPRSLPLAKPAKPKTVATKAARGASAPKAAKRKAPAAGKGRRR